VSIARTSQAQWATERHVTDPRPGDLVFCPGADGTWTSPGHVALVVGDGQMIEAYSTGYPVRQVPIRPGMVGFTDPSGGS
jgi:cell wall-associated NlpC family hydrolase